MSQTEFYKKGQMQSPGQRTPGQILHIKFKDDIGFIRSSQSNWFNAQDDLDSNPESPLGGLRFKYEESSNDLRQRGDGFEK